MNRIRGDAWSRAMLPCVFSMTDQHRLSQAIRDRYRCPEEILDFELAGDLSADSGFFRFGEDAICYGRSSSGGRRSEPGALLYDVLRDVETRSGKLRVPFDLDEIIDNLRLERYPHDSSRGQENVLKKIYYHLRPLTTAGIRKTVKRFHARNWKQIAIPHWPVDTTVENLTGRLLLGAMRARGLAEVPFVWFWPEGARSAAVMTHDVETVAGRDFCADLLQLDSAFGIKASFQIVPEGRYAVPADLLDLIRDRGCEVGVQDLNHDGRLFDDRDEFQRRASLINEYGKSYGASGFRAAVLYRKPEWYSDLDFSYDMSIPNVAHLDAQRGGCCTVMPYFIGKILELPVTTVQDYALFHILNERSITLWKTQVDEILSKHGLISFIVHPDYIQEPDTRSMYEELLRYLQDLRQTASVWFALPREVDAWWRARHQMSVIQDSGSWRIVGEGSERAVLAFAKNINGTLAYEFAETSGGARIAAGGTP